LVILNFIIYFVFQSTLNMEEKYLQDISDIKNMMNKSSQFISLSGLAGIMAGIYALIGAYFAHELIQSHQNDYTSSNYNQVITLESTTFKMILLIAFLVLFLSLTTAALLTINKARKEGESVWNSASKRLLTNFLIPLVTGGIFGVLLLRNGSYGLIAPVTLIFYGLSCVNASKYTLRDVRYLGITIIILGLLSTEFSGYSLEFWALGFGVCHIIYGSMMYFKYDRK
jgi:tryptophan-rich sensory protein